MFGLMRNLYKWYMTRNEKIVKFALIGIDNAGKSTILARIKGEVPEFITPTIGFASESIDEGPYHISIFDLGGGTNIRSIWPSYFAEVHGAIFVVDSADKNRLNVARDALHAALLHARLQKKPLLILANKQDLPEALSGADIALQLALDKFDDFSYNVVACSAVLAGDGGSPDINIKQGLKWLLDTVSKNFTVLEKRIASQVAEQKEEERIEKEEKRKRIEAMRRERELERERQEQEEKERENATTTEESAPKEGAELNTPQQIPEDQGIGMAKEDLKPSPSPRRPPTARLYPSTSFPRMSPRHSATVAPLPSVPTPSDTPPVEVLTSTPRSAWGGADGRDSRRKLEPITLPSPSLQSL